MSEAFYKRGIMRKGLEQRIAELAKEYPLIPYVHMSRLYSTVRRMKAEKERDIPIKYRSGFAVSVKKGKAANRLTKREWEELYRTLSRQLKKEYPEMYSELFADGR